MTFSKQTEAVIFDLDGTLRHNHPSFFEVFFQALEEHGYRSLCQPEPERTVRRWVHKYWAQSPEAEQDLERFGRFTDAFWENYLRKKIKVMGCPPEVSAELARNIRPDLFERYQPEPHIPDDIFPTLEAFQGQGFTLGLVSNRSECFQEEIGELGLAPFFDFAFTAGKIKAWKPNPEIFQHALELAGSPPEETVYVGDNYYTDVIGAQRAGLQAILIDPRQVFPDVSCPVIQRIGQLTAFLPR
jgi:putative hydrolase of the HAD superfamily